MIARQSRSERSVRTCAWSAPGIDNRTGSAPVASSRRVVGQPFAVAQYNLTGTHVDPGHVRVQAQVDRVLGVEASGTQRYPFLGRGAGKVVLGQVRPVHRRRVVIAEHRDAAFVSLAPQALRRCETGGTAADDDDFSRCFRLGRTAPLRFRLGTLVPDEDLAVALLDRPAGKRAQRGRSQSLTGPQVEASVMPWTAHRVADHETIDERAVVMRALGADRKYLRPAAYEQHVVVAGAPHQHAAVRELSGRDARDQVGRAGLRVVLSHGYLLDLSLRSFLECIELQYRARKRGSGAYLGGARIRG